MKKVMIALVFLVLVFLVLSLVITHVALQLGKTPPQFLRVLPDAILALVGTDCANLGEEKYTALVGDMIFALAFLMAAVPLSQVWWNTKKLREELRKEYGIKSAPINEKGKDDLVWMLSHYEKADRMTIFAGGFGWLEINSDMKKRVLELAKDSKLNLVSYRSEQEVKDAFGGNRAQKLFFKDLKPCFRYGSGLQNVVCTMIQRSATEWSFLYKSRPDEEGHAFNVCVLSDTNSTRELLHILSALTKAENWGELDHEASLVSKGN